MKILHYKEILKMRGARILLFSIFLGLLLMLIVSGKTNGTIESIAVSFDEQYVACFECIDGAKISCFQSDGLRAFTYQIPTDISAGGHCALWFEDDILHALFYRTDLIVCFAMNGIVLDIVKHTAEIKPLEFPSFRQSKNKYIYDGNRIDVEYYRSNLLGYWLFNDERYLSIIHNNRESVRLLSWTAKAGILDTHISG